MNISHSWLKEYLKTDLDAHSLAEVLTSIGLEAGSVERVESVAGGLKGLVIGQVLTCKAHEGSDHLHVVTVGVGRDEPLQIVCGAPNVAVGHAVVVATIGTVLGEGDQQFTIKKSKIRGVESYGMLCSEVEIGVGDDDGGIILLPLDEVRIGMPAAEYYGVMEDTILEVDITPNRVDATSHYGVARDLAAYFTAHVAPTRASLPENLTLPQGDCPVSIEVKTAQELTPRFEAIVIRGVKVTDSPEWLRFRLSTIGQKPINNIVDITNYVLHEYGQPLHAYDLDKIAGRELVIDLAKEGQKITLLDHVEYTLSPDDILISDAEGKPLCLAGVMGGEMSATTDETVNLLIEVANFNASAVRKTARRLGLSTDTSFRFERGLDAEMTSWALARAVSLILELCPEAYVDGGKYDFYPVKNMPYRVELSLERMDRLIGVEIPVKEVESILDSLEIKIVERNGGVYTLEVPRYRIDVTRDVDVIEDILRIYGYNRVPSSRGMTMPLGVPSEADKSYKRRLLVSEQLVGAGFNEILCNSLSSASHYEGLSSFPTERLVRLLNPLSAELGVMRQTLLFGGLQSISRNYRRQAKRFYFFEWGNCYSYESKKTAQGVYRESIKLGLWVAGERTSGSWTHPDEMSSPFELKAHVAHILKRLGINTGLLSYEEVEHDMFASKSVVISADRGSLQLGLIGQVSPKLLRTQEIDIPVYYAELEWGNLVKLADRMKLTIADLPKYPQVKRDLSLLLEERVSFGEIEAVAYKAEKKLLRCCELFDVYEGDKLPSGKKSYAVSFYLRDDSQTMSDKQIDGVMSKIQRALEAQLGASLR